VLALCSLVASACTASGTAGQAPAPTPSSQRESHGPAGRVPAGLARFYGQTLSWNGCTPYAQNPDEKKSYQDAALQCARLSVPLDYGKPHGKTITLGLLRYAAGSGGKRIGSLVVNPGGPGASGMQAAAALAGTIRGTPLHQHFDLVGFDPRGVGASRPRIRCFTDDEQDRVRSKDLDVPTSPKAVAAYENEQKKYAHTCATRTKDGKAFLKHMGTKTVAKDMDVLRSALGDKKLNYLGFSYGTRLGSAYAERYPDNVRAMVLDGAVDPTQTESKALVAQATGFQTAFEKFAGWCAEQQQCALGADPSKATHKFRGLVVPLIKRPLPLPDGRKLTYDDATTAATQALYTRRYWKPLNQGLQQLEDGKGRVLMALADLYYGRGTNGHYSTLQDAFTAIRCVDHLPMTSRTKIKATERKYDEAAPFLDDGKPPVGERDACAFWPVPPTSKPHLPQVSGLAPILVVSTTNDPATPYQAGVNLAKALGGRVLTYRGTQHTAFLEDSECVNKAGIAYLVHLHLPPKGKEC
jgi:pimeloyl-ACP methyl ester carboxylesterase